MAPQSKNNSVRHIQKPVYVLKEKSVLTSQIFTKLALPNKHLLQQTSQTERKNMERKREGKVQPKTSDEGVRCGWAVNATPRRLYTWKRPGVHPTGSWVGPWAGLNGCGKSRPIGIWSMDSPPYSVSIIKSVSSASACTLQRTGRRNYKNCFFSLSLYLIENRASQL